MKTLSVEEIKEKAQGEVNEEIRKLFAAQYDIETHNKLLQKKGKNALGEKKFKESYEIIFRHFQDYCSKGPESIMEKTFGIEPKKGESKRELWEKKRDELALFMIRAYSGVEDRKALTEEMANWIAQTKKLL